MAAYSHQQHSTILPLIVVLVMVTTAIIILLTMPQIEWWLIAILVLACTIGYVAARQFSSLNTEVDGQNLRWWFGKGFWRKTVPLADIASAEPVTNKWWWGWGIRYYGKGWLYNVSGLDAVEIILKSGKHIRIGTDDPQGLAKALSAAD